VLELTFTLLILVSMLIMKILEDASPLDSRQSLIGLLPTPMAIGKQYGVAREARAIAVKVFGDNGSGSNAGVIAGIEDAQKALEAQKPSVINMSWVCGPLYKTNKSQEVLSIRP